MALSASIRSRLQYQHETVAELIEGFSEQQLRRRTDPAKWSVFENIAHLTCYQPMFLQRIRRMREEDNPFFPRYVADSDPAFPGYVKQSLAELLGLMLADRNRLCDLVDGMDEVTLQRTGLHARYGQFPMSKWMEFFLLHESHHLYTIFMMAQELRKESA